MTPDSYLQRLLDLTKELNVIALRRDLGKLTPHEALQTIKSIDRELALAAILCPYYEILSHTANIGCLSNPIDRRGSPLLRHYLTSDNPDFKSILALLREIEGVGFNVLDTNTGNGCRLISLVTANAKPPKQEDYAYSELINYIVRMTSDIDHMDHGSWLGWTIPTCAIKNRNLVLIEALMRHGADFDRKTNLDLSCDKIASVVRKEDGGNDFYVGFLALKRVHLDNRITLPEKKARLAL